MECDTYQPILLTVRTVQFSDISAILINLIHLFQNPLPQQYGPTCLLCVLHGTRHTLPTATLQAKYNSSILTSRKGSS